MPHTHFHLFSFPLGDEDSIKRAELAAAAAQEDLERREREYAKESELARAKMSDRHQRQRDRMLVKLEQKKLAQKKLAQEKEKAEKLRELQAKEELARKQQELAAQGALTEETIAKLEKETQAAMLVHQEGIEKAANRNKERMQQRLKAKRAQKKLALKRKHEEERAREQAAQDEERRKLEGMSSREREMKMLEGIMVRGANEERVDEAIEMIMHDRHAKETADLITRQYEERTRVIRQAMEDLLARKRAEIEEVITKLKDEGASETKITETVEEVGKKYAMLQAEAQRSAADDLETKHSQAQLDLRQQQLQEIANALSHLAPQDILVKKQAEQKQRQVEELAEFRRTMEDEASERIARIKREKAEFEDKLRKQNEKELQEMERAHEEELEKERREGERRLRERKKAYAEKQKKQQGLQLEQMGQIDDAQRAEILARFEEEQRRVLAMMSSERDRQLRVLESKLRSRRERHGRRAEEKLRADMEREQRLMRERIAHVAEQASKSIAQAENVSKMSNIVFSAAHQEGKMQGEQSAVHMAMIGKMSKSWRAKARVAKERREAISQAARDMQTPAQRAAARANKKGFWAAAPELTEEEAAEAQKKNLEEVERLHAAMQRELDQNKNDMSEKAKNRHGKLLARLEAKKKRMAKKAERAAKKAAEAQAEASATADGGSGGGGDDAGSAGGADDGGDMQPTMMMPPTTPVAKKGGAAAAAAMQMSIPTAVAPSGGGGGGMDPAKERLLFSKLESIEQRLSSIGSGGSSGVPSALARAAASGVGGADLFAEDRTKDRQFSREGSLSQSDPTSLGDHERQRLGFGAEILKIFGMDRGSRKVQICVASALPHPATNMDNNAFGNSVHWDAGERVLYVREERLESVGEFALLLVHTLAHIQADPRGSSDSMGNDADPRFIQQFVKGMKLVTQSLFMSNQQVEKLRLIRPGGANAAPSVDPATKQAAEDEYYKTASLHERMNRYRAFRNRPELLSFVSNVEGAGTSGDTGDAGGSSEADLGKRLENQLHDLQRQVDVAERAYRDQLSHAVSFIYLLSLFPFRPSALGTTQRSCTHTFVCTSSFIYFAFVSLFISPLCYVSFSLSLSLSLSFSRICDSLM